MRPPPVPSSPRSSCSSFPPPRRARSGSARTSRSPVPSGGGSTSPRSAASRPPSVQPVRVPQRRRRPTRTSSSPRRSKGVITSWSFRAGLLRPTPRPSRTTSTLGTFKLSPQDGPYGYACAAGGPRRARPFEIPPGNVILSDPADHAPGAACRSPWASWSASAPTTRSRSRSTTRSRASPTPTSSTASPTATSTASAALLISALVEPDADQDGYGDETQDCAPADAAVHEGCAPASPRRRRSVPPPADIPARGRLRRLGVGRQRRLHPPVGPAPRRQSAETGTIAPPTRPQQRVHLADLPAERAPALRRLPDPRPAAAPRRRAVHPHALRDRARQGQGRQDPADRQAAQARSTHAPPSRSRCACSPTAARRPPPSRAPSS